MKKIFALVILLAINVYAFAQIEHPVQWSYAAKKINTTEAIVFLKATIQNGWHIYSLNGKEGGPIKTSFTFAPSVAYVLKDKTIEPKPITRYENTIKMNVSSFEKEVVFQQKIKLKSQKSTVIKGKLEYMACNNSKCNPPEDLDFIIPLGK